MLSPSLIQRLQGRFVVFEGPDGSGKSTQLARLLQALREHALHAQGLDPCHVREPGGTRIGELIRSLLLDHHDEDISVRCETLLYMASRAQLVERIIRPALLQGRPVLADRFVSSTIAYQGAAGGMPVAQIKALADIAVSGLSPDLVLVFDVTPDVAATRLSPLLDRMESKGRQFHQRVREAYLRMAQEHPTTHALIDASLPPDAVHERMIHALTTHLAPPSPPAPTAPPTA